MDGPSGCTFIFTMILRIGSSQQEFLVPLSCKPKGENRVFENFRKLLFLQTGFQQTFENLVFSFLNYQKADDKTFVSKFSKNVKSSLYKY